MPAPEIVRTPDDLTAQHLQSILQHAGVLDNDTHITRCDIKTTGTGQMGGVVRATLGYSKDTPNAPESVIVKLASNDATARHTGLALGIYQSEVNFYKDIAPHTTMTVPHTYFAELDPAEGWFTIVMKDLGKCAQQGDVLAGGTVAQAKLAMEQLARLQAPFWNNPELTTRDWLNPARAEMLFGVIPPLTQAYLARFGAQLNARHTDLIAQVMPKALDWFKAWSGPMSISHGDYRLDNMMLATVPNADPMTVVDWQTVKVAPPTMDVSYYLGACLSTEDRRLHQTSILQHYQAQLAALGIDYPWDALWNDYRRYAVYGLILGAFALKVPQTERGDSMFAAAAQGYADLALDLESASFLA